MPLTLNDINLQQDEWIAVANEIIRRHNKKLKQTSAENDNNNSNNNNNTNSPGMIEEMSRGQCHGLFTNWCKETGNQHVEMHFASLVNMITHFTTDEDVIALRKQLNQELGIEAYDDEEFLKFIKRIKLLQNIYSYTGMTTRFLQCNLKKTIGAEFLTELSFVGDKEVFKCAFKHLKIVKNHMYGMNSPNHIMGLYLNNQGKYVVYDSNESFFSKEEMRQGGKVFNTMEEAVDYCDLRFRACDPQYKDVNRIGILEYSLNPNQDPKYRKLITEFDNAVEELKSTKDKTIALIANYLIIQYRMGNLSLEQAVVNLVRLMNKPVIKTYGKVMQELYENPSYHEMSCVHGSSLHMVATVGDAKEAQKLIAKGLSLREIDSQRNTPLHVAVAYQSYQVALVYLAHIKKYMPDVIHLRNNDGYTVLDLAVIANDLLMVNFLLDHGAAKEKQENALLSQNIHSALFFAIEKGHIQVMETILQAAPQWINLSNTRNETPLFFAAQQGNQALVDCLLKRGADLFASDHLTVKSFCKQVVDNKIKVSIVASIFMHADSEKVKSSLSALSPDFLNRLAHYYSDSFLQELNSTPAFVTPAMQKKLQLAIATFKQAKKMQAEPAHKMLQEFVAKIKHHDSLQTKEMLALIEEATKDETNNNNSQAMDYKTYMKNMRFYQSQIKSKSNTHSNSNTDAPHKKPDQGGI